MNYKDKNICNIKVNCNLEFLQNKLLENNYKLKESFFKLYIYMIPDEIDILNITNLSFLDSYIIIKDINGENKKMVHKNNTTSIFCNVDNIIATKKLLQSLNYNELMYINYDIYNYTKNNINIKIKNILKQGLFIEGDEDVINILNDFNISYDSSNLHVDNEYVALVNIQNEIKKKMK